MQAIVIHRMQKRIYFLPNNRMDVLHALVLARAKKRRKGVSTGDNKAEVEALAGVIYFASPWFPDITVPHHCQPM